MRRRLRLPLFLGAVAIAVLYVALWLDSQGQPGMLQVLLLAGPAAGIALLAGRVRPTPQWRLLERLREWAYRPRRDRGPDNPELRELGTLVDSALGTGFVTHRLRRLLAELAGERLWMRHQIDWERDPAAARALLGDSAWRLLREDPRRQPDLARGMPVAQLRQLIESIEAL